MEALCSLGMLQSQWGLVGMQQRGDVVKKKVGFRTQVGRGTAVTLESHQNVL